MTEENPCLTCGACCAAFRVVFYWAEAEDGGGDLPLHLTGNLNQHLRFMQGTNQSRPRCAALEGEIGRGVRCTVYEARPSPCREFLPSSETPAGNPACDGARARYGLPPLVRLADPLAGQVSFGDTVQLLDAGLPWVQDVPGGNGLPDAPGVITPGGPPAVAPLAGGP